MNIKKITLVGIFSGLSLLLYLFKVPFPLFPTLSYDLSDVPAFVIAIIFSPLMGVLVLLVKNILDFLIFGSYVGIPMGQVANFLSGFILVFGVSFTYHRAKRFRIKDLLFSGLVFLILICFLNYFFILPVITSLMGINIDQYVANVQAYAPFVKDFKVLILFIILPFNLIKAILIMGIGVFLSNRLSPFLKGGIVAGQ